MGLGRSPGAVTCPLAYLNYLYTRPASAQKGLFAASGEMGQKSGMGNHESTVLFTTPEVRQGLQKGRSFAFIDNPLWRKGGKERADEAIAEVIEEFFRQEFRSYRKKLHIYWCDLELDKPNLALERVVRVLLAFSPTGKQGKEIWANLTGGTNVLNAALFWVGYLSGKISRYYYINAQAPNNRYLRPFSKDLLDGHYWVSFPNLKMAFDANYYAVVEELMTNPKSPLTGEELLSCLKNSSHGEYFGAFENEAVLARTILLHMMGHLLDRDFYVATGKLRVSSGGRQIYEIVSDDLFRRLLLPVSEQEDEIGRQKALLETEWFFQQRISIR